MESDFSQGQYDIGACPGPIEMPSFDYESHKYTTEYYSSQLSSMESLSYHFQSCATSSKVTAEDLVPALFFPLARPVTDTDAEGDELHHDQSLAMAMAQSPVAPLYPHLEFIAQVSPESASSFSSELDCKRLTFPLFS